MGHQLTSEEYNKFSETKQKELLVVADKVAEYDDAVATYQLFRLADFFIEVKINFIKRYRKILNTYNLSNIPFRYAGKVH